MSNGNGIYLEHAITYVAESWNNFLVDEDHSSWIVSLYYHSLSWYMITKEQSHLNLLPHFSNKLLFRNRDSGWGSLTTRWWSVLWIRFHYPCIWQHLPHVLLLHTHSNYSASFYINMNNLEFVHLSSSLHCALSPSYLSLPPGWSCNLFAPLPYVCCCAHQSI